MKIFTTKRVFSGLSILLGIVGVIIFVVRTRQVSVYDAATRQPVVGATVTPIYSSSPSMSLHTDSRGGVLIDGYRVRDGSRIEVSMTGYLTQSVSITNGRGNVVVLLRRSQ